MWNVRGTGISHKRIQKLVTKFQVCLVAILEPFQLEASINMFVTCFGFNDHCKNEAEEGKIWVLRDAHSHFDMVRKLNQMVT